MSRTDFCRLSPEQFYWISKAHRDEQERLSRERWEIMRMEAAIMIQPHVKNRNAEEPAAVPLGERDGTR